MSFLKKIFGGSDPLASVRKAVNQNRWADALTFAEGLEQKIEEAEGKSELESLQRTAWDGLALLNLHEGEACLRAGEGAKAREHLVLARSQAKDGELIKRIDEVLSRPVKSEAPSRHRHVHVHSSHGSCSSGCGSTRGAVAEGLDAEALDREASLELVLASYPEALAELCREKSPLFVEAFLLAHEGRGQEALKKFETVEEKERDVLFFFERGSALGRLGGYESAALDLEKALRLNSSLDIVWVTLINLDLAHGMVSQAENRIETLMKQGRLTGFCHAQVAVIALTRKDTESALTHGLEAIRQGMVDKNLNVFCASHLEAQGRLQEAESVLSMISGGGGCSGGGINPFLAEFYLRHNRNIDKAMEAFKAALRSDGENPRWYLRIGQSYLLKGWKKEGLDLVSRALEHPDLSPELAQEGRQFLAR